MGYGGRHPCCVFFPHQTPACAMFHSPEAPEPTKPIAKKSGSAMIAR